MPSKAHFPCRQPACGALVVGGGYCAKHKNASARNKVYEQRRGTRTQRGYSNDWLREAALFLRAHPLCACPDCQSGKTRALPAQVVDHRIPHRGDMRLFWDKSNWQPMNKACHDRKTIQHDGGMGNPVGKGTSSLSDL